MSRVNPVLVLALMLAVILAAAQFASPIDGQPTAQRGSITVSTLAVGFPATACRVGAVSTAREVPALVQIQTNGIYYLFNSATATPVATDYVGYVGDILEIAVPSLFRALRSGSADATLAYQCFER